jgi:hypothetical protein
MEVLMPILNETRPKKEPTISQRSKAEVRKANVQFFLLFDIAFTVMFFITLPFSVALTAILTGHVFALVTWASGKVR